MCLLPLFAWGAGFVEGADDIPLMDGLVALSDRGLNFSSPEGRIVDAYAQGPLDRTAVLNFYAETLPELGWKPEIPGRFRRDDEILTLDIARNGQNLILHFALRTERASGH